MKRFRLAFFIPLLLAFLVGPVQAQQVNFGLSSAIGEREVFVGQPMNTASPGAVFVFQRSLEGDAWDINATLTASDGAPGDAFGQSFLVEGATLIVGAPNQSGGHGAVYIFERDQGTGGWMETERLSLSEGDENDKIGVTVASNGDAIVAGAPARDENAGAVFVFHKDAETDTWTEAGLLVGSDVQAGDLFGMALAADDERIYVGAPAHNEGAGAVYVFRYDASTKAWTQETKLESSDAAHQALGVTIQVQDGLALAGAPGLIPGIQPSGPPPAGAVVTFQRDDADAWTQQATLQPGESGPMNLFGFSINLNEDKMMIGAPGVAQFSGAAYLFERNDDAGTWQEAGQIPAGDGDQIFGLSLAARGNVGVVGVPGANFGEGAAAIVMRDAETGQWSYEASITPTVKRETLVVSGSQVSCSDGVAGEYECNEIDLLSFMPIRDIGGEGNVRLNDIWGWTDPETDREYALVGRTNGTSFVDITDPLNPIYLGDLPLTDGANPSTWRDVKVYQDHAFVVADNSGAHGMQVFDLTQLRDVTDAPVTFEETAHYDGIFSAHNIVINEESGFAYAVGSGGGGETCGGGLHMIDIREPTNPTFAGCFADTKTGNQGTGYSHDAQCVIYNGPDTEHRGKEICFGSNETALSVADVTDKDNPVALARASYPKVGYSHQGWLTEDHSHFFMNDELDELQGKTDGTRTLIWDVTDLDDPQLIKEHVSDDKASDHNLYIKGNLMYQSNYLSGLRIFDISDVANPVEVGYFDTVPGGANAPGFGGSWSNYPYFKSGSIIITSMSEGLFVLKKREVDI